MKKSTLHLFVLRNLFVHWIELDKAKRKVNTFSKKKKKKKLIVKKKLECNVMSYPIHWARSIFFFVQKGPRPWVRHRPCRRPNLYMSWRSFEILIYHKPTMRVEGWVISKWTRPLKEMKQGARLGTSKVSELCLW